MLNFQLDFYVEIVANNYPISLVTEQPDKNRCFKSHVGSRISVSCVKRAQPLTSNNFNFVLVFKMRCKNSSFMSRDSSASEATDSSSNSGKPGDSIFEWKMDHFDNNNAINSSERFAASYLLVPLALLRSN